MQSKIILLKIAPSLIIAAAVLAGLLTGAEIISKSIVTVNTDYMSQSERVINQASREVTEALASINRFHFATNPKHEKDIWNEDKQPSHYLFDSLTGAVYANRNGNWYLGSDFKHKNMKQSIGSSADWKKFISDTETSDRLDRLIEDLTR